MGLQYFFGVERMLNCKLLIDMLPHHKGQIGRKMQRRLALVVTGPRKWVADYPVLNYSLLT